ncbi:MAG: acyl carrier protein [Planctomycetes bacterium]|nr:acyl carrier protein [Planctomycetota bacterium]
MENSSQLASLEVAESQIIAYLSKIVGGTPRPSDSLAVLGVDSVAMAELTFELEKRFGIQIDDDILDVDTIRELTQYVISRQRT